MKEIRHLKTNEKQKNFEHKTASPANTQNADATLLHSHDEMCLEWKHDQN